MEFTHRGVPFQRVGLSEPWIRPHYAKAMRIESCFGERGNGERKRGATDRLRDHSGAVLVSTVACGIFLLRHRQHQRRWQLNVSSANQKENSIAYSIYVYNAHVGKYKYLKQC